MATPTKTEDIALLAWQAVASAACAASSARDASTLLGVGIGIKLARTTGTAFTAGWPNVRVEVSPASSGNDAWQAASVFQPAVGASIANTTLSGAVTAGDTTCGVASATNIAVGDLLFLGHTTDTTKYELVRVKGVSGTTITFEEACTYAHDSGAQVTDQAEQWACELDLTSWARYRVVADNAGSGQGIAVRALATEWASIG